METVDISCKQRKRKVLLALGIAQVVATLATLLLGRFEGIASLISVLAAVGWAVAIIIWVGIDSEERGTEVSSGLRIALLILGFFALSYYLIKTRGLAGGLKAIGWALLFFILVFAIYMVIAMVIFMVFGLAGVKV